MSGEILKMIEEVSPDHTPKLDEIDARVSKYLDIVQYEYERREGFMSEVLPTEELAELHAIIQAIQHGRNKG